MPPPIARTILHKHHSRSHFHERVRHAIRVPIGCPGACRPSPAQKKNRLPTQGCFDEHRNRLTILPDSHYFVGLAGRAQRKVKGRSPWEWETDATELLG